MNWLLITFASASISFTATRAGLLSGLRDRIGGWGPKWAQLTECPYCVAHYIVFLAAGLLREPLVVCGEGRTGWWTGLIATVFASICGSALLHGLLLRAYRPMTDEISIRMEERIRVTKEFMEDRPS